ncbi:MAG: CHRD domain-containing protein [bacterium]
MKLGHKPLSFLTTTVFAAFLLISATSQAQIETYRARLSPMPTTPQTVTTITGEGEVLLTLNGHTLSIQGKFEGMTSVATMAHIHNGPPAQPGPVIHQLGVSSASAGEINAELELTDQQITALRNNSLYIQIHSGNNPPGELRGWIFARN